MRAWLLLLAMTAPASADDVLVRGDASLRVEADGPAVHLGGTSYIALHVVATRGKQLEVEPACASALRTPGLAHVHLFVAKDDLAYVVTKPVHAHGVNVVAGLPVVASGDKYLVDGKDVPASAVGKSYPSPSCPDGVANDDATGTVIPAGTDLTTPAGRPFAVAAAPIAVTVVPGAKKVCVARELIVDDGAPITVHACAPVRALREASHLK